jgi:hypothetical protein
LGELTPPPIALKLADGASKTSVEEFNTPSRCPCQHSDFDRFVVSKEMAMTRVFVLTNHKGGGGKSTSATTIALGIAAVLRRAGAPNSRVLLIDTDSQGHATLITTGQKDAVTNDFYRQALDLDLRGKREYTDAILSAMGGMNKSQFSRHKALLTLSDEALELADRHNIEERKPATFCHLILNFTLRSCVKLSTLISRANRYNKSVKGKG